LWLKKKSRSAVLLLLLFMILLAGCEELTNLPEYDDGLPPAVPTGARFLYATDGETGLEWRKNPEPDFDYYEVYRSDGDTLHYVMVATTRGARHYDDSLDYGTEYFYRLTAVDRKGNKSQMSLPVAAIPLNRYPPPAPRNLTVSGKNDGIQRGILLSWGAPFVTDVMMYHIYRDTIPGFALDTATYRGHSFTTAFLDDEADSSVEYHYKVLAEDKGLLRGDASNEDRDLLHPRLQGISPADGAITDYFTEFVVTGLPYRAEYEVLVTQNPFFGEVYRKRISAGAADTVRIPFTPSYLTDRTTLYWRVITYSKPGGEYNSVSHQQSFTFQFRY